MFDLSVEKVKEAVRRCAAGWRMSVIRRARVFSIYHLIDSTYLFVQNQLCGKLYVRNTRDPQPETRDRKHAVMCQRVL